MRGFALSVWVVFGLLFGVEVGLCAWVVVDFEALLGG